MWINCIENSKMRPRHRAVLGVTIFRTSFYRTCIRTECSFFLKPSQVSKIRIIFALNTLNFVCLLTVLIVFKPLA